MAPIPVTGVQSGKGPHGEIPLRVEIHDLQKDIHKWSLYVLALRIFYDRPADHPKSYFQISGIHGMPYLPWNGEEVPRNGPKPTGYCTHSTVLFPSWHRPYVVLYEQLIQEIIATEILPKIPQNDKDYDKYKTATETFRIPFWDWAAPPPESQQEIINKWLPPTSQEKKVPNLVPGFPQVIDNPLYQYVLKPQGGKATFGDFGVGTLKVGPDEDVEYGDCVGLSRCPENKYYLTKEEAEKEGIVWSADFPGKWREGEILSYEVYKNFTDSMPWFIPGIKPEISKKEHDAAENVWRLFNYSLTYPDFATNGDLPKDDDDVKRGHWYQSLESIHNNVHLFVGGGNNGHMTQVPVASFDPFFWLHHANVERFYSIWQYLHDDQWFGDTTEILKDSTGNMLNDKGEVVDNEKDAARITVGPKTPLAPFRNNGGNFYTSNDVRNHTVFNYTYPELQNWKYPSKEEHKKAINAQINKTYGGHKADTLIKKRTSEAETLEVVINVSFYKFLFSGMPFNVKIYLQYGDKKDPAKDYIGNAYNFSAPSSSDGKEVCSNCTILELSRATCTAQVVVSHMLKFFPLYPGDENIDIENADQVEKFLKKRLYVQIISATGREIVPPNTNDNKPAITVSVAHCKARYSADDTRLTTFGAFQNFLSLAGDVAELLVVGTGALVLTGTGAVLGTVNNAGEVILGNGSTKSLKEVSGITNKGARDLVELAGGLTAAATGVLGGGLGGLGGSGKKDDRGGRGGGFGLF
ncbi:tyrosinase [Histoplasma capsulatum var. duboisii H88]|uniref:tyrosinase n=3 Tax=Ajellomyces capsulatus TaxID=5037 RepID=F0UIE3_AJEC8|nr:tyrosinase [Histoplasma capsulatum H143]EGC46395.1 tyrosinase [Histoplasma capsulatum var. duboisii H88]KAG5302747.1 tyrosinase [Histoplasma capsulatum]QSS57018.1 tyrosinase [Histoplasma capsulatum var. duboisii H88]QSS71852.1 tyrosinase [Histoplasma capsulatum G186AR]